MTPDEWEDPRAVASETDDGKVMRRAILALSGSAVVAIIALHYVAAIHLLGVHDLLRRLFYLPVVTAAIVGGRRGGLVVAGLAVFGYLPHLHQLAAAGDRMLDHALELVLLPTVALLVGSHVDASREARRLAEERGRLAALGEVGMAVMTQVSGPLTSIEGHCETVAFLARSRQEVAIGFAAGVIQREAVRMRRLFHDLRAMGSRRSRQESFELAALVLGVANDLRASEAVRTRLLVGHGSGPIRVGADRGAVAFALRSLILRLFEVLGPEAQIAIEPAAGTGNVGRIEIRIDARSDSLHDLMSELGAIVGASAADYALHGALCLGVFAAEGASVAFERLSQSRGLVTVRFSTPGRPPSWGAERNGRRASSTNVRHTPVDSRPRRNPPSPASLGLGALLI